MIGESRLIKQVSSVIGGIMQALVVFSMQFSICLSVVPKLCRQWQTMVARLKCSPEICSSEECRIYDPVNCEFHEKWCAKITSALIDFRSSQTSILAN